MISQHNAAATVNPKSLRWFRVRVMMILRLMSSVTLAARDPVTVTLRSHKSSGSHQSLFLTVQRRQRAAAYLVTCKVEL